MLTFQLRIEITLETITSFDTSLAPSSLLQSLLSIRLLPCLHQTFNRANFSSSPTLHSFRRLHSIDTNSFLDDLKFSPLTTNLLESLDSLLVAYNTTLSSLLDQHAPVITKLSKRKSKSNPWFTTTVRALRSTVRRAENLWKRNNSALHRSSFKPLRNQYHRLIITPKKQYFSNLVSSVSDNPKRL